jgi:hypothetical protein
MGGGIGECFRVMFIFNGYLLHHPARACMWLSLLTLWYSCQANRVSIAPPPRPADTPPHRPAENELVEVAVKGEDGIVDAWCEGNVTKIKGDFVYVAFSAVSRPEVVELDRLRAAQNHAPARLEKRNFELAEHLRHATSVISRQLDKIADLSKLLRLAVAPEGRDLIAIGTTGSLKIALKAP